MNTTSPESQQPSQTQEPPPRQTGQRPSSGQQAPQRQQTPDPMKPPASSAAQTGNAAPAASSGPPKASTEEEHAAFLRHGAAASALWFMNKNVGVSPEGARLAYVNYMNEIGATKDVVERMIAEQILLIHHRLMFIHMRANLETSIQSIKSCCAATVALTSEMRHLVTLRRSCRTPPSSGVVIHQQNVATSGGKQEVQYSGGKGDGKDPPSKQDDPQSKQPEDESLHELRERLVVKKAKESVEKAEAACAPAH